MNNDSPRNAGAPRQRGATREKNQTDESSVAYQLGEFNEEELYVHDDSLDSDDKSIVFRVPYVMPFDARISDQAYRTLEVLRVRCNEKPNTWVSVQALAKDRGLDPRTIKRHLLELKKLGWIRTKKRNKQGSVYRYFVSYRKQYPHDLLTSPFKFMGYGRTKEDIAYLRSKGGDRNVTGGSDKNGTQRKNNKDNFKDSFFKEERKKEEKKRKEGNACSVGVGASNARTDTASPVGIPFEETDEDLRRKTFKQKRRPYRENFDIRPNRSNKRPGVKLSRWNEKVHDILTAYRNQWAKHYPGMKVPNLQCGRTIGTILRILKDTQENMPNILAAIEYAFDHWQDSVTENPIILRTKNKYGVMGSPKRPNMLSIERLLKAQAEIADKIHKIAPRSDTAADSDFDSTARKNKPPDIDEDEWVDVEYYDDLSGYMQ